MSKPRFTEEQVLVIKLALEFFVSHAASYLPHDIATAIETREAIGRLELEHDYGYISAKLEEALSLIRSQNLSERESARNQKIRPPSDD